MVQTSEDTEPKHPNLWTILRCLRSVGRKVLVEKTTEAVVQWPHGAVRSVPRADKAKVKAINPYP